MIFAHNIKASESSALSSNGTQIIFKEPPRLRIGFINPTFTYAAYQNNSFYNFYSKYYSLAGPHTNITTDLSLIRDKKVPHEFFLLYDQKPGQPPGIPHKHLLDRLVDTVAFLAPTSNLTFINDQELHAGKIFYPNGSNSLDLLILVHEEYQTQEGYDNLKRFVAQGGTIIFMESNVLTVEVKYDPAKDTITLVKGHLFQFDGKVARRSVEERWLNETAGWLGSNFLPKFDKNTYFKDMPFNYTHTEEQYLSNPNVTILYDYKVFDPLDPKFNKTVAAYEMKYGKGKILNSALFGDKIDNDKQFFEFFKSILLPRAIGDKYNLHLNGTDHQIYGIAYNLSGSILKVNYPRSVTINLSSSLENRIILNFPKSLFALGENAKNKDLHFDVKVDNSTTSYSVFVAQRDIGFEIGFANGSKILSINVKSNPSPFSVVAPPSITLPAQGPLTEISNLGKPTIHGVSNSSSTITNDAPDRFPLGITVVKWTASDEAGHSASDLQIINVIDENLPTIKILYPSDRSLVRATDGEVVLKGTAYDKEGVKYVDIQIRNELTKKAFPYSYARPELTNKTVPYVYTRPDSGGNWSSWSFPINIKDMTNPISVTARVTDVSGHRSWDRLTFAAKGLE